MTQLALAVANYHDTYGKYPPAAVYDSEGTPMHSWRVLILPFLEQRKLYEAYDMTQPWDSPQNLKLASEMPSVFAFHGYARPGNVTTNYLVVVGDKTLWSTSRERAWDEISDDPGSTIMLVENDGANVHWMQPLDLHIETMSHEINDPRGISSPYEQPATVLVDGSLRKLDPNLPKDVLLALLTSDGGEPLSKEGKTWRLLSDGRHRKLRK